MRVEMDLDRAAEWLAAHPVAYMLGGAVAWYWVVGQAVRVAYRTRPHWFDDQRLVSDWKRKDNAFQWWAASPLVLPWLVSKAALWVVTLGAVKPPWKEFP